MSVSAADLDHWRGWIGRSETRGERLDPGALRRFAAALGEDVDVERVQPSLGHWAFFLPVPERMGDDGHALRGGFLPPIPFQHRMFAASNMRFTEALALGAPAERTSTILDVAHKIGRSGEMILVQIEHRIVQDARERVIETQTIAYRDKGAATTPVPRAGVPVAEGDAVWEPGPAELFRFSAATFNTHRIHYDLPYARDVEGYPDLVVHGPFTAARLFGHARRGGRAIRLFRFRAVAPLFCGQPIVLKADDDCNVRAVRCDGADAMTAYAES